MRPGRKIILDTNIWISYIIGRKLDEIAKLILAQDLIVYSCKELEEELKEVLSRDKFRKLLQYDPGIYLNYIQNLTISIPVYSHFEGCPDKKDNFLFDLAIQSKSDFIVTGDKLLLTIKVDKVDVVSFTHFRSLFSS
ncbi:MAG: putative toxin-antitoxin system toxin component, PIN family [Cyclobacteriaceae bacterium]